LSKFFVTLLLYLDKWTSYIGVHDMMEGRDYGQLKDLVSDRSRWRQDSK